MEKYAKIGIRLSRFNSCFGFKNEQMFGFCSKKRTEGLAKGEKRVHNKCAFGRELGQKKNLRLPSGRVSYGTISGRAWKAIDEKKVRV